MYGHLGGGVIFWDRLRLALSLPLLIYNVGETGSTANATFSSTDGTTVGDLRLGADVRLLGTYGGPLVLAIGPQLHLPTGSREAFSGDGKVRLQPRLMAAGDLGPFAYAGQLSFNYRAQSGELDGAALGSEVGFVASAGLRVLREKLLVGPELYGSTVVSEGDAAFARRTTPVELSIGGKYRANDSVRVGAGIGPGLTRGMGAPKVRILASLEWLPPFEQEAAPAPEPSDRDGDGILDVEDACPDLPGEASDDPEKHGCPPPSDSDGDGIFDDVDACPKVKGLPNDNPKKHGCPKARVERGKIEILERVEFATDSARILPESDAILNAVLKVINEHPEFTKISVEGHTDSRGNNAYNMALSGRRAAAVVKWLTSRGLVASRLQFTGFGEEQPIDTNDTDEGRQNNRRVEFKIVESKK